VSAGRFVDRDEPVFALGEEASPSWQSSESLCHSIFGPTSRLKPHTATAGRSGSITNVVPVSVK
jgi:hypothetical protein